MEEMMDSKNFPTVLFVRNDDSNNEKALVPLAYTSELNAVVKDGPTLVARYELVEVRNRVKTMVEVK
jgi:hypothetical protein